MFAVAVLLLTAACGTRTDTPDTNSEQQPATPVAVVATPVPSPEIPNLQDEIADKRFHETTSPLGSFDFKNFTYPLPRRLAESGRRRYYACRWPRSAGFFGC